jgi:hypothetical protein
MSEMSGRCGPHTTIATNEATRVTQCGCGVYHVNLIKKGVSFQLGADDMRRVAEALGLTARVADAEGRCASLVGEESN